MHRCKHSCDTTSYETNKYIVKNNLAVLKLPVIKCKRVLFNGNIQTSSQPRYIYELKYNKKPIELR